MAPQTSANARVAKLVWTVILPLSREGSFISVDAMLADSIPVCGTGDGETRSVDRLMMKAGVAWGLQEAPESLECRIPSRQGSLFRTSFL